MRFIPTKVHAVLDYVVAIALILAPTIFMFEEVGGAAVIIPASSASASFSTACLPGTNWAWSRSSGCPCTWYSTFSPRSS